jgi:NAD(P)-dependent dehydrogenase (short-subunit alcohol dehydrogenase family)
VLAIDNRLASAEETAATVAKAGGECVAYEADITKEAPLLEAIEAAHGRWGRIDILHNNVESASPAVTARQPRSPKRPSTASPRSISAERSSHRP